MFYLIPKVRITIVSGKHEVIIHNFQADKGQFFF